MQAADMCTERFQRVAELVQMPDVWRREEQIKPAMTPSIGVAAPKKQTPNFNTPGVLAQKEKKQGGVPQEKSGEQEEPERVGEREDARGASEEGCEQRRWFLRSLITHCFCSVRRRRRRRRRRRI